MTQLAGATRFALRRATNLTWKSWSDSRDWIVFDANSRQTHLLDELSAFVLKQLEDHPLAPEELAARLVVEFDIEAAGQGDAAKYVANLLPKLCELGLIESVA